MGPSNGLSCETGSFSHHCNPLRFLQPEVLRLYLPALEPWVAGSVLLPSCFSQFFQKQMWDHPVCQPLPCRMSFPPRLPISSSPTSLDEGFFFNSLVGQTSIQFNYLAVWLFLFLNWLLSFFLLCKEVKHIYLHLQLGQKSG